MDQARLDYADPEAGRPRRWTPRRVAALLALLLAAYAASYVALLNPGQFAEGGLYRMNVCRVPGYRVRGEYAYDFYRPALWVDHRVWPGYWDWRIEPPEEP